MVTFKPIVVSRVALTPNIKATSIVYIPAKWKIFRRYPSTCCPHCGELSISRAHRIAEVKFDFRGGICTAVTMCCDMCHTLYYYPTYLLLSASGMAEITLRGFLDKFEGRTDNG